MQSSTQDTNTQLSSNLRDRVSDEILAILDRTELLSGEHAQANLEALTRFDESQIDHVLSALRFLEAECIGASAQECFELVISKGVKYACNLKSAFWALREARLLAGDKNKANRGAVFQGGGEYASVIARGLVNLHEAGLLAGEKEPTYRDLILQCDGRWAREIARALVALNKDWFLNCDQKKTNLEVLIQGEFEVACILEVFECLNDAGPLSGEQAQKIFDVILQEGGIYEGEVSAALKVLSQVGLLNGQQAQICIEAILQNDSKHACFVAGVFAYLNKWGLFNSARCKMYSDALVQSDEEIMENIDDALMFFEGEGFEQLSDEKRGKFIDDILQDNGKYADSIAIACMRLNDCGLLSGEKEKVNREAIFQYGGKYALPIARALVDLHEAGLLAGEKELFCRDIVVECGGHEADVIAGTLVRLSSAELLNDIQASLEAVLRGGGGYAHKVASAFDHIQELCKGAHCNLYIDAIMQNVGQYVGEIASALCEINRWGKPLSSEQVKTYINAITQRGGEYAVSVSCTISHFHCFSYKYREITISDQIKNAIILKQGRYASEFGYLFFSMVLGVGKLSLGIDELAQCFLGYLDDACQNNHGASFVHALFGSAGQLSVNVMDEASRLDFYRFVMHPHFFDECGEEKQKDLYSQFWHMVQSLRGEEARNECLFDFEYDTLVNNAALICDAVKFFEYAAIAYDDRSPENASDNFEPTFQKYIKISQSSGLSISSANAVFSKVFSEENTVSHAVKCQQAKLVLEMLEHGDEEVFSLGQNGLSFVDVAFKRSLGVEVNEEIGGTSSGENIESDGPCINERIVNILAMSCNHNLSVFNAFFDSLVNPNTSEKLTLPQGLSMFAQCEFIPCGDEEVNANAAFPA